MISYRIRQLVWMLQTSLRLMLMMSTGVVWFFQMIRLYTYGVCMFGYFLPHIWWYLTSDHIIRRVSYRSSELTKRRDVLRVLEEDGLAGDWWRSTGPPGPRPSPSPSRPAASSGPAPAPTTPQARLKERQKKKVVGSAMETKPRHGSNPRGSGPAARPRQGSETSSAQSSVDPRIGRPPTRRSARKGVSPAPPTLPSFTHPREEATSMEDAEEEDRMNIHNRATVDIILPVPLDSLMKTLEVVKSNTTLRRRKFPIIIILSGGAWIIGSHLWATMVARTFAARGYVVFCPDYRNFPQTTMEGMTLDVSDAIAWVLQNAERYNGDLGNVTLMGQSAGAHLTMMSLLSQAHLAAYQEGQSLEEELPPPSDVAYNVPRYNPRQSIHHYVGVSGMYNLEQLMPNFHQQGLSRRVLGAIAGGRENLPRYCLNTYFDSSRSGEVGETLPDNLFDHFPKRMSFLHGGRDSVAPPSESASLVGTLRLAQQGCAFRRVLRVEEYHRHWAASLEDHPIVSLPLPNKPDPTAAVDFQYVFIPDARHTDGFVEECIVAGRSCCVDYVCDYETTETSSNRSWGCMSDTRERGRPQGMTGEGVAPDTILTLAVPPSERPRLLRLFTLICPF